MQMDRNSEANRRIFAISLLMRLKAKIKALKLNPSVTER